jgi:purine-binding chemotaxis protein CheW
MDGQLKLVVFNLEEQRYGFPLQLVTTVEQAVEITVVPDSPYACLGVVNVRGTILTVVDTRLLLGLPTKTLELSDCFIVANNHSASCIFLVDSVLNITETSAHEILPINYLSDEKTDYLAGYLKKDSSSVFVLNVDEIMNRLSLSAGASL